MFPRSWQNPDDVPGDMNGFDVRRIKMDDKVTQLAQQLLDGSFTRLSECLSEIILLI